MCMWCYLSRHAVVSYVDLSSIAGSGWKLVEYTEQVNVRISHLSRQVIDAKFWRQVFKRLHYCLFSYYGCYESSLVSSITC